MSTARLMQMAAAGVSKSLFGPSYGNWDGSLLRFSSTYDGAGSSSSNWLGTQMFIDSDLDRVYSGYNNNNPMAYYTGSFFLWNAGNVVLSSRPVTTGITGCTMAYQNDKSYILFGAYTGSFANRIYVYLNGSTPVYKGTIILNSNSGAHGIAIGEWSNTSATNSPGLRLFVCANSTSTQYYDLPDFENLSTNITASGSFSTATSTNYQLTYAGRDGSDVYFYFRNGTSVKLFKIAYNSSSGTSATQIDSWTSQGNGSFGTTIDYENKYLYTGGLSSPVLWRYPLI